MTADELARASAHSHLDMAGRSNHSNKKQDS